MKTTSKKTDVYALVTEKLIARLEAGVVPWHKPWTVSGNGMPRNMKSLKPYRGINSILLAGLYASPFWLTYRQAEEMGGNVKKGEKASLVVYWNWIDVEDKKAKKGEETTGRKIPFLRYYHVFNVEQCEGLEEKVAAAKTKCGLDETKRAFSVIEEAKAIVETMPNCPPINHGRGRAAYSSSLDNIMMPEPEEFDSPEHYYGTLFHELVHSTGHQSRLNRDLGGTFGTERYGKEELVAEMGAAFLSALCGITDRLLDNSAAYLANWIAALKGDAKLAVCAAQAAQKAADYITRSSNAPVEEVETAAAAA